MTEQLKAILRHKKEKWKGRTVLPLSDLFPSLQAYHKGGFVALHLCFMQPLLFASTALYGLVQTNKCGQQTQASENRSQNGDEQRLGAADSLYNGILLPSG